MPPLSPASARFVAPPPKPHRAAAPRRAALPGRRSPDRFILWMLVLAAAIRLAIVLLRPLAIEGEGAEYAAIARNLLAGRGYVGTLEGGVQLLFPPLYPLLIAALAPFSGDFEDAGRLVSLISGTLLVAPITGIAFRLYGLRVARIAGLLTAIHPLFVTLSTAVFSEAPFLTLLMTAVYFGLRCVESPRPAAGVGAGMFAGLAYLTRPEALLYVPVLLGAMACSAVLLRHAWRATAKTAAAAAAAFLAVGSPYIVFLSLQTGSLRLEGKSMLNHVMAARMNSGMSYAEASYGLGPDLEIDGPVLNVNEFVRAHPQPPRPGEIVAVVLESAQRNIRPLYFKLLSLTYGAPLAFLLVSLGLFARPWSRERLAREALLLGVVALIIFVLLAMNGLLYRYTFPILPLLLIWSSKGIDESAGWLCRTAAQLRTLAPRRLRVLRAAARLGFGAAVTAMALVGTRGVSEIGWPDPRQFAIRTAGLWLGQYQPGPKRIFDLEPMIAFYAEGTLLTLPYADSATCLRYIESKTPDFIVLKDRNPAVRPFLAGWLRDGIPDPRAKLIYESGDTPGTRLRIYAWRRAP